MTTMLRTAVYVVVLALSALNVAACEADIAPVAEVPDAAPDAMVCSYCSGPVAIVGGGDVECLGTIKTYDCGPVAVP